MLVPSRGLFLELAQTALDGLQVLELQLEIDDLLVPHRVHTAVHMGDIGVIETAEYVQDGVRLADIGQELVAETLTLAGPLDEAGDIDYLDRGRDDPLGMYQRLQHLEPGIGNSCGADIWLNGAEREIRSLGLTGAYTVEKCRLAHVGESYYTAFERHIYIYFNILQNHKLRHYHPQEHRQGIDSGIHYGYSGLVKGIVHESQGRRIGMRTADKS